MPKAKNKLTPDEQMKRFDDEIRKRSADGDFDPDAAELALDKLVSKQRK